MATESIHYVDTDVVGGDGSGSSWANAFATSQLWETHADGNLVTGDIWEHAYVRGNAVDAPCLIDGWTTDATRYILVEGSVDATGRPTQGWDDGKYTIVSDAADENGISTTEFCVRIDGLQIYVNCTSAVSQSGIRITGGDAGTFDIRISNSLIKGNSTSTGSVYGILWNDVDASGTIWNTAIFGFISGADITHSAFRFLQAGTVNVINCVAYGNYDGFYRNAGTINVYNSASFNNTDDFNGTITCDYCASDDADGTNHIHLNSNAGGEWDACFTGYATGDFSLKSTATILIGTGSVDPVTPYGATSFNGVARGAAWDVGIWEYVAAGGTVIPVIMHHHLRH